MHTSVHLYNKNKQEKQTMIQKKKKQTCSRGSFGKLLPNQNNRHPLAPHLVGQVEIDSNLFEQLVELYDSGKALRLQIAGWKKMSDTTGQTFLTLKITMPFTPNRQIRFEDDDESDSDDVFSNFD
jgi:hypothetical protein